MDKKWLVLETYVTNMATSLTVPVMMVFAFLPMLSMFNETIKRVAKYIFTQQMSEMLGGLSELQLSAENVSILGVNAVVALVVFAVVYKKSFGK